MKLRDMTAAQKIDAFVKLRDHKKACDAEYKKSMEDCNTAMEKLQNSILEDLQASGSESMKTSAGTAYISPKVSITVKDRDAFFGYCDAEGDFEYMDIRANTKVVREALQKGKHIPGINVSEMLTVNVRRPQK